MNRPLLIGIGNRWRGDDGAGAFVVERLADALGDRVDHCLLHGEGAALIEAWEGRREVWLFDAAVPAGEPGRIRRFDALAAPLPAGIAVHSSHRFGVVEAIEMARTLELLPAALTVCAIEGGDFEQGDGLSPAVRHACQTLCRQLADELGATAPRSGKGT